VLPERGELGPLLEQAGAEVVARPLSALRRGLVSPRGLAGLAAALRRDRRELRRLASERGAALVHSNTSVVLAGNAPGLPHLLHVREIYAGAGLAPVWPWWRRRLLRADALACVSEAAAAQFGGAPHAFVLHDGLARTPARAPRAEARAALGLPDDRFVVAVLGRVSDWKGQDVLARALAHSRLAEIDAIGLVAGDPWAGDESPAHELRELARTEGLGDRLRLLGFRDDVDVVLGAADAVAVPSKRPDPFPNSALEAAAAGVPVVAAAHGGLTEIVTDGETGLLTPPRDPAALAHALRRLADDTALVTRLGEAAARDTRARFSRERMLARVEEIYDRLAAGSA
jgi:glycosyltransferase involved in cell wall biosynthesis